MAANKANLVQLSDDEDKSWTWAFTHYKDDGCSDAVADQKAWEAVCEEFPHLREYDGAKS